MWSLLRLSEMIKSDFAFECIQGFVLKVEGFHCKYLSTSLPFLLDFN
jgi:hypothetical protein